jgi:hypothetical protein
MQQQLADTKAFATTLNQLQKEGLNATTESQLAQAGTATGLPLAEGLAQGGKAAIAQVNADEAGIIKASQKIGTTGGTAMYNAGLQASQGLASGLKAALKSVDTDMAKEAALIVSKMEKELGSGAASSASSGSSAASAAASSIATAAAAKGSGKDTAASAADAGLSSVGSAASGAASGLSAVASAASGAASALSGLASAAKGGGGGGGGGGGSAGGSGSGSSGGGGGVGYQGPDYAIQPHYMGGQPPVVHVTHNHTWNVPGFMGTPNDLMTIVQDGLLKLGSQNWQTGVIVPGRHN